LLSRLADASDQDAWIAFQERYQPAVYRYARSCGLQTADALEVVQEVMIAVHRAMGDWRPSQREGSFRAWLAETARRVTLQILRQKRRIGGGVGGDSTALPLSQIIDQPGDGSEEAEYQRWLFFCAAAQVEREVQESTWRAFWMTAVLGQSPEQVAIELEMQIGTVYASKCRVLARIRRSVEALQRGESS
jgi:RNA polymerase sigma factor (sigma-70 family)